MRYAVRLFSLAGKFSIARQATAPTLDHAKALATDYATAAGFSRVQFVDDEDSYAIRVTATTPNGRAGRNVASIEPDEDFS